MAMPVAATSSTQQQQLQALAQLKLIQKQPAGNKPAAGAP
jgi:hypothetical protein